MAKAKATKEAAPAAVTRTPQDILKSVLNANKEDHYNDMAEITIPKISTGSLILDSEMGGGVSAGLVRPIGFTEGGKTSWSLEVARNFLNTIPKGRALLVKAEGRLSPEMQERSGLKFVWKTEDWVEGTCFVLETNVYDVVIGVMRELVVNNTEDYRYVFILDSMDGLILKSDMEKQVTENGKVAGAPALTKKFLQRLATAMNKFGHICIMIGQVSSNINIDNGPKEVRQISATGGNAALHWANWILQFEPRWKEDIMLEKPDDKPDLFKNKILGHWCRIIIKKSPNEKSNGIVRYPIKYGRTGGTSIWREYEIVNVLMKYEKISRKASWMTIDEDLINEIKTDTGLECKALHQGEDKMMAYLEENPLIADWFFVKLKKMITL